MAKPRAVPRDDIYELRGGIGAQTSRALRQAGIERVSALRARLEEHETLRRIPGIGAKREADIRAALNRYDAMSLPLEDPALRRAAAGAAALSAVSELLAAIRLTEDREWADRLRRFAKEELMPVSRMTLEGLDEVTTTEIYRVRSEFLGGRGRAA